MRGTNRRRTLKNVHCRNKAANVERLLVWLTNKTSSGGSKLVPADKIKTALLTNYIRQWAFIKYADCVLLTNKGRRVTKDVS